MDVLRLAYVVTGVHRSHDGQHRQARLHRILGDGTQALVHAEQVAARRRAHDVEQRDARDGLAGPGAEMFSVVVSGEVAQVFQIRKQLLDDARRFLGLVPVQSGHPSSM